MSSVRMNLACQKAILPGPPAPGDQDVATADDSPEQRILADWSPKFLRDACAEAEDPRGTHTSAALYRLIETTQANDVAPYACLRVLFATSPRRLPRRMSTPCCRRTSKKPPRLRIGATIMLPQQRTACREELFARPHGNHLPIKKFWWGGGGIERVYFNQ